MNGCIGPAALSQPCANSGWLTRDCTHELTEVRFDTGGLLQAYEVRDYRHAPVLLIAKRVDGSSTAA